METVLLTEEGVLLLACTVSVKLAEAPEASEGIVAVIVPLLLAVVQPLGAAIAWKMTPQISTFQTIAISTCQGESALKREEFKKCNAR